MTSASAPVERRLGAVDKPEAVALAEQAHRFLAGDGVVGRDRAGPHPRWNRWTTREGASRMSSVLGLKARPQTAIRLPSTEPSAASSFANRTCFCVSFTRSTASSSGVSTPFAPAVRRQRLHVFGKARAAVAGARIDEVVADARGRSRCRGAPPRCRRRSAPPPATARFMKEILVASIALAAYLVSSAERTSMNIMRSWLRLNGA